MKTAHLSPWEQEEYVLGAQTPSMAQHLGTCAACQSAVARMEESVALFRQSAMLWSEQTLRTRPQSVAVKQGGRAAPALRWAIAAVLLVMALLPLALLRTGRAPAPKAISDQALLEQVDEQVSVAVPDSMESLTYLASPVDTDQNKNTAPASRRSTVANRN